MWGIKEIIWGKKIYDDGSEYVFDENKGKLISGGSNTKPFCWYLDPKSKKTQDISWVFYVWIT